MEHFVRQTLARAAEVGNRRAMSLCLHALGAVSYLRGRWPESRTALQRSIELARAVGGAFGEVLGAQRLALLETRLGEYEPAHERARQALHQVEQSDNLLVRIHSPTRLLATLAENRFAAGDLAGAMEYLAQGFAAQDAVGECITCDVLLYPAAVPAFLAAGDLEQAEALCRRAESAATAFRSQAWAATARYLRGLLAAAQGDPAWATECLEWARGVFESLDQPYDIARSLEALANVAAGTGEAHDRARAGELRRWALARYQQLGAAGDARRLKALRDP